MADEHFSIALNHGLVLLALLAVGLVYTLWFKRSRASLGFIWLIWLTLGLAAQALAAAFGLSLEHDLAPVALGWLPWNLLLLALIPYSRLRSLATVALLAVLLLELAVPLMMPIERWQQLTGLNAQLPGMLPAAIGEWLTPVEPVLVVAAALVFFARWQWTGRNNELALSLMSTALLPGVMRPEYLEFAIGAAAIVLFAAALYGSHRMAFVDALTGLPNRRSLDLALRSLPRRYAIGMVDVDHFKRINDRFGHDFGDQVLRMVAARLRRVRGYKAYRYGGEEFCLLFRGRQVEKAEATCEQARAAMADPPMAIRSAARPGRRPINKSRYREKVPGLKMTVSIGLAVSSAGNEPESVIEAADKALYRAKRGGRNKVVKAKTKARKSVAGRR